MPSRPALQSVPQTGMDETVIDDTWLEDALEAHHGAKAEASAARKAVKEAKVDVDKGIEKLELPDGHAVRVGRFRITRRFVAGRHVEFDAEDRSQVDIAVVD